MPIPARSLALAVAAIFAVTGCDSDGSAPSHGEHATTPPELARLVPASSTIFVQIASLDALEGFVRGLGAGDGFTIDPADLLGNAGFTGVDARLVARDRPLGLALTLPEGALAPEITALLPVSDVDAFVSGLHPGRGVAQSQGYVGLSTAPGYAAGENGPAIAALPTELFAVRANLGALIEATRPLLDAQLTEGEQMLASLSEPQTQAQGIDTSSVLAMYFDFGRALLDSIETLDLALTERGTLASFELDLTMRAGSTLADLADGRELDLASVIGRIDPDAAISFVGGGDVERLMQRLQPFSEGLIDVYPESMRAGMRASMQSLASAYHLIGDTFAGDLSFGAAGMSLAAYVASSAPEELRAKYLESVALLGEQGVLTERAAPQTVRLGEHEATKLRFEFDTDALAEASGAEAQAAQSEFQALTERFFGPDGAEVWLVPAQGELAVFMAPDDAHLERAVQRIGREGADGGGFEWVLERFGDASPMGAYRMDLPRMLAQIEVLVGAGAGVIPGLPPELSQHSLPAVLAAGLEGRRWRGGISLDRRDVAKLVAALQDQ